MCREFTNKLIELVEEGFLSYKQIFDELMRYLSEDEIKRFCLEGFAREIADLFKDLEE